MTVETIVWATLTGALGLITLLVSGISAWLLRSHLALQREFDQWRGEVKATFSTPEDVKDAVTSALAPLWREIEAQGRRLDHQGRIIEAIARQMHIPAVHD